MSAIRSIGVTLVLGLVWAVGIALLTSLGMSQGGAKGVAFVIALLTGPVWGALLSSTPHSAAAAGEKGE